MPTLLLVFLGGGVGSLCRYGTSTLISRWLGTGFPAGTLIVNLLGSFLIGCIAEYLNQHSTAPVQLRLLLITGFLGGYTTFSAFSLESAALLQRGDYGTALAYILVSVLGTIALVLSATWLMRQSL
jgi:CrcB protein